METTYILSRWLNDTMQHVEYKELRDAAQDMQEGDTLHLSSGGHWTRIYAVRASDPRGAQVTFEYQGRSATEQQRSELP